MVDFWQQFKDIEDQYQYRTRAVRGIHGDYNFAERMFEGAVLDTGVGQLARSLKMRFEQDGFQPEEEEGYYPLTDPQIQGYEDYIMEFVTSSSPKETEMRLRMIDRNRESRALLEDHGLARFMGNIIDPINIIPIPLAKGMGFVKGFGVGAAGTAVPLGVSEGIRSGIDPTSTTAETVFNISGGALFGGALGGLVGSIRPKQLDEFSNLWFGIHNNGVDAYNRLVDKNPGVLDGLKPLVERQSEWSEVDHLSRFIMQGTEETTTEYLKRLKTIADDPEMYEDVVTAAKLWQPDQFIPTHLGVEKIRTSQHPYFLLKNNKFDGELGNMLRRVADRIAGPPGMMTLGAEIGEKQAQGVYNKATLLNVYAKDYMRETYNSYLRSIGLNVDDLTPGQQVAESLRDLKPSRAKAYSEFMHDVTEAYLTGGKFSDPHVNEAARALQKYMERMGDEGIDAGVLGVNKIIADANRFETYYNNNLDFLKKYMDGDELAGKEAWRMGLNKRIERQRQTLDEMTSQYERYGSFKSEKQLETYRDLRAKFERNLIIKAEVDQVMNNPAALVERIEAGYRPVSEDVIKAVNNYRTSKGFYDRATALEASGGKGLADIVDPGAMGYYGRQWNHEAIRQNRDHFIEILERHYAKDGGELQRANSTISKILREMDVSGIKKYLGDEMRAVGASDEALAVMERKLDEIARTKASKGQSKADLDELRKQKVKDLVRDHMRTYGFGDDVYKDVAATLDEIERVAASGEIEGLGTSIHTFNRRLKLPSELFIRKADGSGAKVDFIETDPFRMVRRYHKRMSANIEMAREFGDARMETFMRDIEDAVDLKARRAKTKKEADEIRKEGKLQIQAIKDLSEKVLGIYNIPADPSSIGHRSLRVIKNFMVMSLMGKAAVAALADIGRVAMSVGVDKSFGDIFSILGSAAADFKAGGKLVQEFGEACEMALHGRFEAMFDLDGYIMEATPFERLVEGGVQKMFILNMLTPYTDLMKRVSGAVIQSEMARLSIKWAQEGKLPRSEMLMLTKNGIGLEEAQLIASEFKKHGKMGTKLHLSNAGTWDDPMVAKTFKTAVVQEINNAVITPGPAEKLNFMSTPVGSLMTQFKSFGFSATHRTLLSGLQHRDARALHGILSMIAMGYLVDVIKSPSYDNRDFLSSDRFLQAVDYSGATGILFDINNMVEVMSGNKVGMRPLLGVDSFFQDPNLAQRTGQVGGPVASLGLDLANTIFNPDADGSDAARSVRRLLPFNNLIWWSWAIDRIQRSAGEALDDED